MSAEHVSDFQLDALRLASLTDEQRTAIELHLSSCDRCQRRRETLARSAEAFAERFDAPVLATDLLQRAPRSEPRWRLSWMLAPALAAAIALIFVTAPEPDERTKGTAELAELYQGDERVRGPVRAGSVLRVRIAVSGTRQIRILWQAPSGSIAALFPDEAASSIEVSGMSWLPREIVLDGEPSTEILHTVTCEAPFDHARAISVIGGGGGGCEHHALEVTKR